MTDYQDDQDKASEWYREVEGNEEREGMKAFHEDPAASTGLMFCNALAERKTYLNALNNLVTPESREAWGDFSEAADFLDSVSDAGFGTKADRAFGDNKVAYFKILSNIPTSIRVIDEQPVLIRAVLTLVYRHNVPVYNGGSGWLVHGLGQMIRPEELPHGSV